MACNERPAEQNLKNTIKRKWSNLSEDEISFYDGMRDMFFIAVRRKYGTPRAQAEGLLRQLENQCSEAAA